MTSHRQLERARRRHWRRDGAHWLTGGTKARGGGAFYAGCGEWVVSAWWSVRDDDLWVGTKVIKGIDVAMKAVDRWLDARRPRRTPVAR